MYTTENTELHTWFERDRSNVRLEDENGNTVLNLWDEAVSEAVEDGFLSDKGFIMGRLVRKSELHHSACEMANNR